LFKHKRLNMKYFIINIRIFLIYNHINRLLNSNIPKNDKYLILNDIRKKVETEMIKLQR